MTISTNAIFHFTNSMDILKSILLEGFKIKYCMEVLRLGIGYSKMAHPMVSFCDIPLSLCKNHIEHYGGYGIGLKKEWAFKNKINPVLYIDRHSITAEALHKLLKQDSIVDKNSSINRNLIMLKCCMKNYSGELNRCGMEEKNYRFYDEREWRFIPDKDCDIAFKKCKSPISLHLDDYSQNKEKYNNQISNYRLKFSSDDIEYILIKSKDERLNLITFLRSNYICTNEELNMLFCKIRTIQELEHDI